MDPPASTTISTQLRQTTFARQLKKLATENPDKLAYIFHDKHGLRTTITRGEVWDKSRKFAAILHSNGVTKGDVVCNTLVNSPERLLTSLGTVVAGAISMHGHVLLADGSDLIRNLQGGKCNTIIIDPDQENGPHEVLQKIQYKDEETGKTRWTGLPDLTSVIFINVPRSSPTEGSCQRWLYSIDKETEYFEETTVKDTDIAYIFMTSGTSGFSKLVPHSQFECLQFAEDIGFKIGVKSDQSKCLLDTSMGWIGGFPSIYLVHGMTRICTDLTHGKPEKLECHQLKMINEEGIDCGGFVPTVLDRLLKLVESGVKVEKRMRTISTGGMPIARRLVYRALKLIADAINITYVSTECGLMCSYNVLPGAEYKDYCVGLPNQGFEIAVVDDSFKKNPTGELGQLTACGPTVAQGYTDNLVASKQCFTKDGAFLTGDMAYQDENGFFYVLCRQSNAIHRGSFIHYPGWLESSIKNCPGVEQLAVVGIPDPHCHEEICACAIPAKGEELTIEALTNFCKTLFKEDIKSDLSAMPRYFLLFEQFPLNPNGKLDRKLLKQAACQRLDIELK